MFSYDFPGKCVGSFAFETGVSCCEVSADGHTVAVEIPGQHEIIVLQPYFTDHTTCHAESVYEDESRKGKVFNVTKTPPS